MATMEKVFETYARVIEEGFNRPVEPRYQRYAVSNLRGGVGKSTLTFNLAFELSREHSLLLTDVCPQRNLTELIFHQRSKPKVDIYNALRPRVLGPAFGEEPDDISYYVGDLRVEFKSNKKCYFVPGSGEFFAFPSALYQQLNQALANSQHAVTHLLTSLAKILQKQAKFRECNTILMDTSPFYGGGTHLAWCAADALIIPVRVDEHSIESLELTLRLLSEPSQDFMLWNSRAGNLKAPRVAAVVMTMVGSSRTQSRPDRASCMYIERALALAEKHASLFDCDPSEAIVITDDFVSSGRISGAKGIPIASLSRRRFHTVEGQRLQVNQSIVRYQRQLKHLAAII